MTKPLYVTMGIELDWIDECETYLERGLRKIIPVKALTKDVSPLKRTLSIRRCFERVAYAHLQLPGNVDASWLIETGFDCAYNYFLSDWRWAGGRWNPQQSRANEDVLCDWLDTFSSGLIMGLLSGQFDRVAEYSAWPYAALNPASFRMGAPLDDEIAFVWILMTALIRSEPLKDEDWLRKRISESTSEVSNLFLRMIDAISLRNEKAFRDGAASSLELLPSPDSYDPADRRLYERLGLEQTALNLIAEMKGIPPLDMRSERSRLMISRSSLGLGPIR